MLPDGVVSISRARWSRSGRAGCRGWRTGRAPGPCRLSASGRPGRARIPCRALAGVRISSAPKAFMVWARSIAQVLRHDQHHAVAPDRRRHRQRDAGIAGGGLDQRVAGLDLAALLGAPRDRSPEPAGSLPPEPAGVVAFELAEITVCRVRRSPAPAHALQREPAACCRSASSKDGIVHDHTLCRNLRASLIHAQVN